MGAARPVLASLVASISVLGLALLLGAAWSYIRINQALFDARIQQGKAEVSERAALAARATAETEGAKADASALAARRQATRSTAQEAQAAADSGAIERGLFGLVNALELAPDRTPDNRAVRLALRRNLDAWRAAHPVLRHLFEGVDDGAFVGPSGTILALLCGRRLRRINLVSGREIGDPAGEEFPARLVAISADGDLVVTHGESGVVSFYERASRRLRGQLPLSETGSSTSDRSSSSTAIAT